ncbi:La-related protein 6 [Hordeum vulgare]|nr:La-related protein 6 [Hordeum vulgare]
MLPVELEERLAQKRCISASSPQIAEVATEEGDDHYWLHAINYRAKVKWPTPNSSGSTTVNLIHGPATVPPNLFVNNFPSHIAIEPLLSFLKDTFGDVGLGSTAAKLDLIDGDHKEGTLSGSTKGREPICDIREGIQQPCSSNGKEHICDDMERTHGTFSSHGNEPICDK